MNNENDFVLFRSTHEYNFEKDIAIDKHDLDNELINHSSLYARYNEMAAEANLLVAEAKDNLSIIQAQLNFSVREAFASANVKATEATVSAQIDLDLKNQEAKAKLRKAVATADKLKAAVSAFDSRRSMLTSLVSLRIKLESSGLKYDSQSEENARSMREEK